MEDNKQEPVGSGTEDTPSADSPAPASVASMHAPIKQSKGIKALLKKPAVLAGLLIVLIGGALGATYLATTGVDNVEVENSVSVEEVQSAEVPQLAAAIALTEGTVQYSSDGGKTWADSSGGETVGELDYVRTLGASRAVVLLDDGSAVRLDSDTTMYLAKSNTDQVEVMLTEGQVYSRVTESETREFSVTTANESFVAKGTAYKTSTSTETDALEVYQSSVEVKSEGINIEEGNKYDTTDKTKEALDLEALETDDFVQWNKSKDLENANNKEKLGVLGGEEKQETPTPAPQPSTSPGAPSPRVNLNGSATDSGIAFSWTLENTTSTDGFKLVRAKNDSTPSFGKDTAVYIGNGSSRSYNLNLKDGATYYFRVCIYRSGGTCDTYSNTVQVTAPFSPPEAIVPGTISNLTLSGQNLNWTFTGTAPHGFKVVRSDSSRSPSYPSDSIQYVSPGQTSTTIQLLPKDTTSGSFNIRVCKWDGSSGCVDYSNEVQYVVAAE